MGLDVPAGAIIGVGCRIEVQGRSIRATRDWVGRVLAGTVIDRGPLVVVGGPLVRAPGGLLGRFGVFAGAVVSYGRLIEIERIWIGASGRGFGVIRGRCATGQRAGEKEQHDEITQATHIQPVVEERKIQFHYLEYCHRGFKRRSRWNLLILPLRGFLRWSR